MKELSQEIFDNIERTYRQASLENLARGMRWYFHAQADTYKVAEKYNCTLSQVAGVVASISPGLSWELNIPQAEELTRAWYRKEELPLVGVYGRRNVEKAVKCLEGAYFHNLWTANAKKVKNFYCNIINPVGPQVTIDRHAKGLALNDPKENKVCSTEYDWLAEHYKILAGELGILPNQLQAVTWCQYRETKNLTI